MTSSSLEATIDASSLATLCWVGADGRPQARGVVVLARGGRPALAFTYADEQVAREVAHSSSVALALSETRSTGQAFQPTLAVGRPRLHEDPDGDVFVSELLTQELRRYPPARLYADSPLLMREHWWYLPRLVVELDVERASPMPARSADHDHLLVVADGGRPVVRAAGILAQADRLVDLRVEGAPVGAGPAVLFGQDASFPDLEQWSQWRFRGAWDGVALTVDQLPARTGLGRPPSLLQRWRRQRAFERRCVSAIPSR